MQFNEIKRRRASSRDRRLGRRRVGLREFNSVGVCVLALAMGPAGCKKKEKCPWPNPGSYACQVVPGASADGTPTAIVLDRTHIRTAGVVARQKATTVRRGEVSEGRFRATVLSEDGVAVPGERVREGTFVARSDYTLAPKAGAAATKAVVLLTFDDRRDGRGCLDVRMTQRGDEAAAGRYVLLGGTKTTARLAAGGPVRYVGSDQGDLRVVTRVRTRAAASRNLPPRCTRLLAGPRVATR